MVYDNDKGKSEFADIKTWVPHGSVLGALLFPVYINDFPTASKLFISYIRRWHNAMLESK